METNEYRFKPMMTEEQALNEYKKMYLSGQYNKAKEAYCQLNVVRFLSLKVSKIKL